MRIPEGFTLTLFEHCMSGREETFEGPIESSDGSGFAGIASSWVVTTGMGGCC